MANYRTTSTPGRKPKVHPSEVVEWRQRNKATRRATAEHFGISETTVKTIWREAGLSYQSAVPSGKSREMDYKVIAEWRRDREASITETAEHFGVGLNTVWRACQEHGVDLSHRYGPGHLQPRSRDAEALRSSEGMD